ncbi:MAG TPA: class I SAM-dependent methyltransferase [Polyangiales bacterium]|nr:class I SAM-dependent methyltransferase [Polyangiales bacterium]
MSTRISEPALQDASRRALELAATRAAFDSVAADYDGPRGNNALIQRMRAEVWRLLDHTFGEGGHLLDLGCGTGLDAVRMARQGHRVTATDWSPCMAERTRERAAHEGMSDRVRSCAIGAHELERFAGTEVFDGAYSNFGALNCVPELERMAGQCARLLRPGGALVCSVIGRICPWEMVHYLRRGQWARVRVRYARGFVRVGLNRQDVYTHYYTPREFFAPFAAHFSLIEQRGLCILAPPPYLTLVRERHPRWYEWSWRVDRRIAGWPLLRSLGDHFVIVMRKRGPGTER